MSDRHIGTLSGFAFFNGRRWLSNQGKRR